MDAPSVAELRIDGRRAYRLAAGPYTFTVLPDPGLLGTSLTFRGGELLSLHGGVAASEAGHTTGLPLLHPWANRLDGDRYTVDGVEVDLGGSPTAHRDDRGLPIHGLLLGDHRWEVVDVVDEPDPALAARLDVAACPDLLRAFPFPHVVEVRYTLHADEGLQVRTEVRPSASRAVPVSFGWHPYLLVPGCARHDLVLELPDREHHELDDRGIPTGGATAEAAAEVALGGTTPVTFDDSYTLTGSRTVAVRGGDLRVVVDADEHYPFAQVFAPAGKPYVALEPMTAPVDALVTGDHRTVEVGEAFSASFTIRAEDR